MKAATRHQHEQLESIVDFSTALRSPSTYAELLLAFYGFYQPLELKLAKHQDFEGYLPDHKLRAKTALLKADLEYLQVASNGFKIRPDLPDVRSTAGAFGCLYVLEGSTLGGQLLARATENQLHFKMGQGCSFFGSYGGHVGTMWKTFRTALESYATRHVSERPAIIAGAAQTFDCFGKWFRRCRELCASE